MFYLVYLFFLDVLDVERHLGMANVYKGSIEIQKIDRWMDTWIER